MGFQVEMKEKVRGKLFYLFFVTMWHINWGRQGFPYCREKSCYGHMGKLLAVTLVPIVFFW